jgi:hypothetical protein
MGRVPLVGRAPGHPPGRLRLYTANPQDFACVDGLDVVPVAVPDTAADG